MGTFSLSDSKLFDRSAVNEAKLSEQALREMPREELPREKLEKYGPEALADHELLAVILRSGVRGSNVLDMAKRLRYAYSDLLDMSKATAQELMELKIRGLSYVKAIELSAVLEIARRVQRGPEVTESIKGPEAVLRAVLPLLQLEEDRELFLALPLDRKNRLKGRVIKVSTGTLDASLVHPREVFRECVRHSAASLIVAHNHPSGDPTPSSEDIRVTRQLVEAGKTLGIPVLDHIIIGHKSVLPPGYISLRDKGFVSFQS